MVLSAAQQTTFFTANDRMGLSAEARQMLSNEGLRSAEDLKIGTKDFWDNFFISMAKPKLVETAPNAGTYHQVPRPHITAASQEKLRKASVAVMYYDLVGRPLALNLLTMGMIDIIYKHVRRAKNKKDTGVELATPILGNGKNIQAYLHAFQQYCRSQEGSMEIPIKLAWVLREEVAVPAALPPLMPGLPWSVMHGSFDAELIARTPHHLIGYDSDNQTIYQLLCDGLRNSAFQSTLDTFEAMQDGRGAVRALLEQHLGKSEWRKLVHEATEYFSKATWNGSSSSNPFINFANKHRAHYNNIVNASKHIHTTIPDEHTRVSNLLTGCICNDTEFCTKKSAIEDTEDDPTGPFYNFEMAVTRLAPACPVNRRKNKRKFGIISSVNADIDADISDATVEPQLRSGLGSTGVSLRWHNKADHQKLSKEQKAELSEWLKKHPEQRPPLQKKEKGSKKNKKKQTPAKKKEKKGKQPDIRREIYSVLADLVKEGAQQATISAATGDTTPVISNTSPQQQPPVSLSQLLGRIHPQP